MNSATDIGQIVAVRADALDTKHATLRAYLVRGSAQVFVAVAALTLTARAFVGGTSWTDVVVVVATLAAIGPVEWIIHLFVLHADDEAWMSRKLGTGSGHRRHHVDPPDLDWLLLAGRDAALFIALFGILTAGWTLPLAWVLGGSSVGVFLTGWACAAIALAHYEWVHLLVHTRYRCRTRYYRRLARNHRLHHYRNERYWLGVTTNSGDRLLRTYPKHKGDVELSDTARTLGVAED